ncbi:MAG: NAD(P)H-hydrate epimerase, partial [Fibrobacterota bacterium]
MHISSVKDIRRLDRTAITKFGIPGETLMENAGSCLFNTAVEMLEEKSSPLVYVVCGKGNNGGDGFVVARMLAEFGIETKCLLLFDPGELGGDAELNYKRLEKTSVKVSIISKKDEIPDFSKSDLIIDAVFGTGFSGRISGLIEEVVSEINESGKEVLSADTPSGINSDTGSVEGICVKADRTVTFALPKIGQLFYPAREFTGELAVGNIGIPQEAEEEIEYKRFLTDTDFVYETLPEIEAVSHKYDNGSVLIIAGSAEYTGAAALCAGAAIRSGAGMVYLMCPEPARSMLEPFLSEIITIPLPENTDEACKTIQKSLEKADSCVFGPGMGNTERTQRLLEFILSSSNIPLIIDADGISCLENKTEILGNTRGNVLITPHEGEFSRLYPIPDSAIGVHKIELIEEFSNKLGVSVLLKGPSTIITDGRLTNVNITGNQ